MKISLILNDVKPITLNHAYTISAKFNRVLRFPSKEYKQLESKVNQELRKQKSQITKFCKNYDEKKHYINIDYFFYYGIKTKKGSISKKSGDVSNLIKVFEDILFKQLTADDSQIISCNVTKIHSENIRTEVDIYIRPIDAIL